MNQVFRWIKELVIVFLFIGFVVTVNFVLFMHSMNFDEIQIREAAPITFINVLFLSALFSVIDMVRRQYTVEKPLKHIEEGMAQLMKGNYSYRIPVIRTSKEYDVIINGLNTMAKELSSVEVLKSDFIANASHEMKTPLAVMQNYCQLMQLDIISESQRKEYAKEIMKQTNKMSTLVTNVLKLNKLERQQIFPSYETFNLTEHVCERMLTFEDMWEKKNLNIETELEDVEITSDKELLSFIWDNLLSNAIKFTDVGGSIYLRIYSNDDYAYVEVQDTGCGMNAETGKHIFQKFYQGDTSHKTEGNGLGLALVKRIVDILDAEITVKSKLNEGSTFTVRLKKVG